MHRMPEMGAMLYDDFSISLGLPIHGLLEWPQVIFQCGFCNTYPAPDSKSAPARLIIKRSPEGVIVRSAHSGQNH